MMYQQTFDGFRFELELTRLELMVHNLKFLAEESETYMKEHFEHFVCLKEKVEGKISSMEKTIGSCVNFGIEGVKAEGYRGQLKYFKAEQRIASSRFESKLNQLTEKQLSSLQMNNSNHRCVFAA